MSGRLSSSRRAEVTCRAFHDSSTSAAERKRVATHVVAILVEARQPEPERSGGFVAGDPTKQRLAQVAEPISYKELGHLRDQPELQVLPALGPTAKRGRA